MLEWLQIKKMKPDGFHYIPGYGTRYSACKDGRIYSAGFEGRFAILENGIPNSGHMVKQMVSGKGYFTVMVRKHGEKIKRRFVHHLILETFVGPCPVKCQTDHIDRNPSNNRIENLRWVSRSVNMRNSVRKSKLTKFRGLGFDIKAKKKWRAQCVDLNSKLIVVRGFETDRQAAIAYDRLALSLLGELAITNKSLNLL